MLEIFRKNSFFNSLLLLPYLFLVRLHTIIHPVAYTITENTQNNTLQIIIFDWMSNALVQNIVANLIIFIHAILINHIFIKHRLSRELTLLPGLVYIILISVILESMLLSPVLIANTFIIFAVTNVMKTYKLPVPSAYIFNTGFYLGIASLLYTPYILMVLFGVIILLILRSFKFTEKLQYFAGFVIPYFFLFTYKYWEGMPFAELKFIKEIFFRWPVLRGDSLIVFYISIGVIGLGILYVLFNYLNITGKKSVQIQKKIDLFYWFMMFCFISFLVFSTDGVYHLLTLSFPLSILLGVMISDSKARISFELIHFLILTFIIVVQFGLIVI